MKKFVVGRDEEKRVLIEEAGEYVVELVGEGARVSIEGKWKVGGDEKFIVTLLVVHRACHTRADTAFRAVVMDRARVEILGKIVVEEDAQQTESFLDEAVLIVSDQASAVAVPDLEIKANEVKCSHAATVGRMDEEQIFYLMSRGLSREKSEEIIIEGFLA